jgi:threonine/homoserine/homoserine lactone efflux protein
MFPAGHLATFALISFVLIIVPGPNVLFVVSRSLMLGRAAGVSTALGGVRRHPGPHRPQELTFS